MIITHYGRENPQFNIQHGGMVFLSPAQAGGFPHRKIIMNKKINSALLAASMLFLLTACGGNEPAIATRNTSQNAVAQILEKSAALDIQNDTENTENIENTEEIEENFPPSEDGIDVDLTRMNATMIYAEVSDMMYFPDKYVGKIVRMRGECQSVYYELTDTTYYSVIIADATACCAQGIEFLLADGLGYPEDGKEITVTGEFELYEELDFSYCRLKDAKLS